MDRDLPYCSPLPEPRFKIAIDDFELPVIRIAEVLLTNKLRGLDIDIYALLGFLAPPGNIKRIPAGYMLGRAIDTGLIGSGDTLVEPTSGNMGVSLAYCGKKHGIKVVAIVSDRLPEGKRLPLVHHGAEVVPESEARAFIGDERNLNCVELARRYAKARDAVFLNQYANSWNPESYAKLVAPALWDGIGRRASLFVAGVGSTGTLMGLGRFFRRRNPVMEIVATMPCVGQIIDGTRDLERLKDISHDWQALMPRIEPIEECVARSTSRFLGEHGIPGGPSSGASFGAAERHLLHRLEENRLDELRGADGRVGVIVPFPDTLHPYV